MNYKALHRKLKIEKHEPHNKPAGTSARVSRSFSTSGTCRVTHTKKPVVKKCIMHHPDSNYL